MYCHPERKGIQRCVGGKLFSNLLVSENRLLHRRTLRRKKRHTISDLSTIAIRHSLQQYWISEDKDVEGLDMGDCNLDFSHFAGFCAFDFVKKVCEGGEGHKQREFDLFLCQFAAYRPVQLDRQSGHSALLKQNRNALNSIWLLLFSHF